MSRPGEAGRRLGGPGHPGNPNGAGRGTQADPPDVKSAEEHYHQALARANALGMRPLAAHCNFGLGKLHRRIGKRGAAQEHLTTATTMYREMGMAFWLEKAEAEQGGVGR